MWWKLFVVIYCRRWTCAKRCLFWSSSQGASQVNKRNQVKPRACKLNRRIPCFVLFFNTPCRCCGDSSWTPIGHREGWVTMKAVNMKMSLVMTISSPSVGAAAGPVWIQGDASLHVPNLLPGRGEELCSVSRNTNCRKTPETFSLCLLSSEGSLRAWRSPCSPPASSTRWRSAATATPWITSLSLSASVSRAMSGPLPHRCLLQAVSLAWFRWGCSVWGSPSDSSSAVARYTQVQGCRRMEFHR